MIQWLDTIEQKQNNNFARASRFFVRFFTVLHDEYDAKCLVSCFMENVNKQRRYFFSSLNLNIVPWNSILKG